VCSCDGVNADEGGVVLAFGVSELSVTTCALHRADFALGDPQTALNL